MSKIESNYFCDLVDSEHARSKAAKIAAKNRLKKSMISQATQPLRADVFKLISAWYHFAILELAKIGECRLSDQLVAKAFGLSLLEARSALERLIRLKALKRQNGTLQCIKDFFVNPEGIPSEAVKSFHRQILQKAILALNAQPMERRDFSALTLAIKNADIKKAKERIRCFHEEFNAEFSVPNNGDEVFHLSTQFFSLLENAVKPNKEGEMNQ